MEKECKFFVRKTLWNVSSYLSCILLEAMDIILSLFVSKAALCGQNIHFFGNIVFNAFSSNLVFRICSEEKVTLL